MVRVCVYSKYRKNSLDHDRWIMLYGQESFHYIKTMRLKGFLMYDFWSQPIVVPGNGSIVVDIIEMTESVFYLMLDQEVNEGNFEELVAIDDTFHSIFVGDRELILTRPLVREGDWLNIHEADFSNY